MIAGAEVVRDGDRVDSAGDQREFFSKNTQGQESRRDLNTRFPGLAEAEACGQARASEEGAGACIRCNQRHGEDESAHPAAAGEIIVQKSLRGVLAGGNPALPDSDDHGDQHVCCENAQNYSLFTGHGGLLPQTRRRLFPHPRPQD